MTRSAETTTEPRPVLSLPQTALAVAAKELRQLSRDRWLVPLLLLWQLVSGSVMVFVDPVVRNLPTVIVDQDRTASSRELIARVRATQSFAIHAFTADRELARRQIRAGTAKVAIVIPPDYGRMRASGGPTSVLALVDGSDSTASTQAVSTLEGVIDRMNEQVREEAVVEHRLIPNLSVMFNPARLVTLFTLPGALAMALGFVYAGRVSRSIAQERTSGYFERLLMTQVNYDGFIIGKTLPWLAIATVNAAVYLLLMRWLVDVPLRGSTALLVGCTFLYMLSVLALGAFVGTAHDVEQGTWTLNMLGEPAARLSGYIWPLFSLPVWLLPIAYLFPQTHFIEIARGICLRGAKLADLFPHVLYLVLMPIACAYGASRRFAALARSGG